MTLSINIWGDQKHTQYTPTPSTPCAYIITSLTDSSKSSSNIMMIEDIDHRSEVLSWEVFRIARSPKYIYIYEMNKDKGWSKSSLNLRKQLDVNIDVCVFFASNTRFTRYGPINVRWSSSIGAPKFKKIPVCFCLTFDWHQIYFALTNIGHGSKLIFY